MSLPVASESGVFAVNARVYAAIEVRINKWRQVKIGQGGSNTIAPKEIFLWADVEEGSPYPEQVERPEGDFSTGDPVLPPRDPLPSIFCARGNMAFDRPTDQGFHLQPVKVAPGSDQVPSI